MEMRKYFKGVEKKEIDGWMMADCLVSNADGLNYWVDTHSLHADEVPEVCNDAKSFSRLVAGLLNCYFNGIETKGVPEMNMIFNGMVEKEEKIPSIENPLLPF